MLTVIIAGVLAAAGVLAFLTVRTMRRSKMKKYYDAAYKMIKEECLNASICNQKWNVMEGQKQLLYLEWMDGRKQGYVFNPEYGVRIGHLPGENELCIRDVEVSGQHCIIWSSNGVLVVQDLCSANGTQIRRGFGRIQVTGAEPLLSGDCILVGSFKIWVTVFTFDMSYM